jgi:2-methylisocitrate lyase-like PEP mutase family enzyme
MSVPGGPAVAALAAAGVRRVSAGTTLAQFAYAAAERAATELLTSGTLSPATEALAYPTLNGYFR